MESFINKEDLNNILEEIQIDMEVLIGYRHDKTDPNLKRWERDTQYVLNGDRIREYDGFVYRVQYAINHNKNKKITTFLKNSNKWVAKYVLKHLRSRKIL